VDLRDRGLLPPVAVIFNVIDEPANIDKIQFDPVNQKTIFGPAIRELFNACDVSEPAIARIRFEAQGFDALAQSFDLFEASTELDWTNSEVVELFHDRLAQGWRYNGQQISSTGIDLWVEQFARSGFGDEAHLLLMYLQRVGYVTETQVVAGLTRLYADLCESESSAILPMSVQRPGKSEQKIAYGLKPSVELLTMEEVIEKAVRLVKSQHVLLCCFDDCVVSGDSLLKYLFDESCNSWATALSDLLKSGRVKLQILSYHLDIRGIQNIEALAPSGKYSIEGSEDA
jgi:hypothetical protein